MVPRVRTSARRSRAWWLGGCAPLTSLRQRLRGCSALVLLVYSVVTVSPSLAWATPSDSATNSDPLQLHETEELSSSEAPSAADTDRLSSEIPKPASTSDANQLPDDRARELTQSTSAGNVSADAASDQQAPAAATDANTLALPTGADKSGVTSQAISVPKGSGKIDGMGESFSAQLSTGIATFSVPFALPAARGGAQPSLGLSYSSSSGQSAAGMGWSVGVPFIARQTDRGIPKYNETSDFNADQDRFVFNGGQELVPICVVGAGFTCTGKLPTEQMPPWSEGAQYFRPRVEGSFLRFFWSADHKTWRVQDKSGITMELGVPLDGSGSTTGIERNPDKPAEIYRWHLVRQYDTYGNANPSGPLVNPTPVNVVIYKYLQDGGSAYVSEIFDTTPASAADTTTLSRYAHHTRLVYEKRTDPTFSFRSGWRMDQTLRLKRVDVTSKTFNGGESGSRRLVRRYHLAYKNAHTTLLASIQVEGRCAGSELDAQEETQPSPSAGEVASNFGPHVGASGCPTLPAMTFGYTGVTPFTTSGTPGVADLSGYEGFDERIRSIAGDPPHSVDEALTDLFDVNSDGLPDVLVTAPGTYGNAHGVFFNGANGTKDFFGPAAQMAVQGVLGANSTTIKLDNLNLVPLDENGDGTIDLLHMPKVKTYSAYAPALVANKWTWVGREITTASGQSPKIDFGQDTLDTKVADVNFDGLVDVVVSTGTQYQTFFALGRYPNGEGQFGSAKWKSASTSTISNDPVTTCVPHAGTPVRLSDKETQLGDMNGDGVVDIVRVQRGQIRYWPGRGNGFWGTGKRDDCLAGTFGANRYVEMASSPNYSDIQETTLRLDDVNGDGLDDLVQVNFQSVDVYLNVDGMGWTKRHIIANTPASPSYALRVRLVDVNGSGTRDILWGNGSDYKYIDLQGGMKPWLLTRVENGLGKSTDIEYSTSTAEMLAAEKTGGTCSPLANPWSSPWCKKMPTVAHIVKRVTERDNLNVAGRFGEYITEYSYRDPVFEGRQREFRGFEKARSRRIGDDNSPTDITESTFLLGECEDETNDAVDDCAVPERWRDNPKEALKGLPIITEKYNEGGVYLSTELTTYTLRNLYTGLDGRRVRHAFASATKTYAYDTTSSGASPPAQLSFTTVNLEDQHNPSFTYDDWPGQQPGVVAQVGVKTAPFLRRNSTAYAAMESQSFVDFFGNRFVAVAKGCVDGSECPTAITGNLDEAISSFTIPFQPPGEETGWLWRTTTSYVIGSYHPLPKRNETTLAYDTKGAPTTVSATFSGAVALDRFHENGLAAVAPSLPSSTAGTRVVDSKTYDTRGNVITETSANGRCRQIGYDEGYAQLPTVETIHVDGTCSDTGLATSAAYDGGLGLLTVSVDMNGQPSQVAYDGFGRLSQVTRQSPNGGAGPLPSVIVEYFLPGELGNNDYSLIHTRAQDGASASNTEYLESWTYVDGLGRTRLTLSEADPDPTRDAAPWIVSGATEFDGKGAVWKKHLPVNSNTSGNAYPVDDAFTSPAACQTYDAFGRPVLTRDLGQNCNGVVTLEARYHALSKDLFDAEDRPGGVHSGTYASARTDGHGRTIATTERIYVNGTLEARDVRTKYLPTGEPEVITRVPHITSSQPPVMRWMRYDSFGRMVLNVDPHTSVNFTTDYQNANATPSPTGLKAWRYLYNDAGDLVGTSDARGCGVNFHYDGAGRLIAEDASPCEDNQHTYDAPNFTTGRFMEVAYYYDQPPVNKPTGFVNPTGYSPLNLKGRVSAVFSRGEAAFYTYDGLGRVIKLQKRMTLFQNANLGTVTAATYMPRWYTKEYQYDAADREVSSTTGATVSELLGSSGQSSVTTTYSKRGTVVGVGGNYGTLVSSVVRAPDGLVTTLGYGDAAGTTTHNSYDERRRLTDVLTIRTEPNGWNPPAGNYIPPPSPGGSQPSFQLTLQDLHTTYDLVGNPIEILDGRPDAEWPAGAKPLNRLAQYDDLYRLKRVDYVRPGNLPADSWTSPFAPELAGSSDPRRGAAPGHRQFANRVKWQTYSYDWLGSIADSRDDANGNWARSVGAITPDTAGGRPYRFTGATQSPNGSVHTVAHDAAGNLQQFRVTTTGGTCLSSMATPDCNLRFVYSYDEYGQLVLAREIHNLDQYRNFGYNASGERVRTRVRGPDSYVTHNLYVFDSLEIRRATFSTATNDVILNADNEVPYLVSNGVRLGRVVLEQSADGEPRIGGNRQHVFLTLGDHLGSTSVVIDKQTSELVEYGTYQAYGATESDYRPDRWKGFREDYRFTGKEEDTYLGLVYFGRRFYSPYLGRWVSPDPLAVHAPGTADLNLYAYVHGAVLKAIDPVGLDESTLSSDPDNIRDWEYAEQELAGGNITPSGHVNPKGSAAKDPPVVEISPSPVRDTELEEDIMGTPEVALGYVLWGVAGHVYDVMTTNSREETFLGENGRTVVVSVPTDPAEKALAWAQVGLLLVPPADAALAVGEAEAIERAIGSGSEYAANFLEGGTGRALAGHGEYRLGTGDFVVPEGTTLTTWTQHGNKIPNSMGLLIEQGMYEEIGLQFAERAEGATSWLPGARIHNYTLTAPGRLTIMENSIAVDSATSLWELAPPNSGHLDWAACQTVR